MFELDAFNASFFSDARLFHYTRLYKIFTLASRGIQRYEFNFARFTRLSGNVLVERLFFSFFFFSAFLVHILYSCMYYICYLFFFATSEPLAIFRGA